MRKCPHCRGTGVVDAPKYSRIPKLVREIREVYPEIPAECFLCEKHGRYYDILDPLFPSFWEMCSCPQCRIEAEARKMIAEGKI